MCVTYRLDIDDKAIQEVVEAAEKHMDGGAIKGGDIYPKAIAPVFCVDNRRIVVRPMMWGFPLQGKKSVNFNARAETMNRLPLFRHAQPIIIPTSGFYEWATDENGRKRFLFVAQEGALTYIAGLFDDFSYLEDALYPYRFTMITTKPSASFLPFHDREPAVLSRSEGHEWLESRSSSLVLRASMDLEAKMVGP